MNQRHIEKKDVPRIGHELRRLRRTGGQDPQRTTGGTHGFRQLRGGHGYRGIRHGTVQPRTTESGLAGCGLRPAGGRRPQTVGRPGGTGARREVPTLAAAHRLGHHPRPARGRHRHVFHAHAIRRPHLIGIVHPPSSSGWDGISTATPGGNCGTARPTWTLWCRTARSLPTSSAFSTCSFRSSGRHGA